MRFLSGVSCGFVFHVVLSIGYPEKAFAVEPGEIKLVCIGDSITAARYYNWRFHLSKRLQREGYTQIQWVGSQKPSEVDYRGDYPSAHEGYYGAVAANVAGKVKGIIERDKPDFAIIHLGTNDVSQKKPVEDSAETIGGIIDNLRQANPQVKILLSIIPHPGGSGAFNKALIAMAEARQNAESPLIQVDLNKDWVTKPDGDTYDWIHPNLSGVLKISERFHAALIPLLPPAASAPAAADAAVPQPDLASGKTVTASGEKGGKATQAVDGDPMTMWAATPVHTQPLIKAEEIVPQWLEVDLGSVQSMGGAGIIWDMAGNTYDYSIEVSSDQSIWTKVVEKVKNQTLSVALEPEVEKFEAEGRFVRITVTRVPNVNFPNYRTGLPAAIREFKIYPKGT